MFLDLLGKLLIVFIKSSLLIIVEIATLLKQARNLPNPHVGVSLPLRQEHRRKEEVKTGIILARSLVDVSCCLQLREPQRPRGKKPR